MRGAVAVRNVVVQDLGIIPARAGSRLGLGFASVWIGDHPRACGEQMRKSVARMASRGSAPRVRGAAVQSCDAFGLGGIIPARAGSSTCSMACTRAAGDHPRACGEQRLAMAYSDYGSGSSPRVRGAGPKLKPTYAHGGIIPARAGSRTWTELSKTRIRDHPRACGEQAVTLPQLTLRMGSSPRVRGAGTVELRLNYLDGIIPARAGSRVRSWLRCDLLWDHPRACGEQVFAAICFA